MNEDNQTIETEGPCEGQTQSGSTNQREYNLYGCERCLTTLSLQRNLNINYEAVGTNLPKAKII